MTDQFAVSTSTTGMVTYPLWLQPASGDPAISFAANDFRHLLDASVPGVGAVDGGSWVVTQRAAGANFSVDIAAGGGVIAGTTVASQGKYLCRSTGTVNLTTPSAPTSGTRTHLVVAEVLDKLVTGSTYGWQFHLVEDTGSGLPATPANAEPICSISIAAGQASVQNANITDKRRCCKHQMGVALRRTGTTMSLSNGTRIPVRYDGEDDDLWNMANVVTDDSTVTLREAGLYDLEISASTASSAGELEVGVYLNGDVSGGVIVGTMDKRPASTSGGTRASGRMLGAHLAAGTSVRAYVWCGGSGMTLSNAYFKVWRREWRAS